MSSPSKTEMRRGVLHSLDSHLASHGFKLHLAKDQFARRHTDRIDWFKLVFLDGKPGYRIQPNVGVRFEMVEEIFHRTSGFEPKYQNGTPTIGSAIGGILDERGDARACEFLLEHPSEIDSAAARIVKVFREFALTYFDKFSSLAAVDRELNSNPDQRSPHRMPWLRCSTGIIVAKLTGRVNYEELLETYTELMSRVDKGFYLKRFQALAASLDSVEPNPDMKSTR